MITGFNTNFRHGGRLFHVQTEDSGRANPHIVTHLYWGGTILASERREYRELLGADDLVRRVRGLMEQQHKSMLRRLSRGEFDASIAHRLDEGRATDPQLDGGRPADAQPDGELATDLEGRAATDFELDGGTATDPQLDLEAGELTMGAGEPLGEASVIDLGPADALPRPAAATGGAVSASGRSGARSFGEGVVSHKPLDQVILEYLVERARGRSRPADGRARGSHCRE